MEPGGPCPRCIPGKVSETMIDFKTAVKKALEFLADVYANESLLDVRLEEIELSEDERFWNITLSYRGGTRHPATSALAMAEVVTGPPREYKVIAVRSLDGEVQSMKIRELV